MAKRFERADKQAYERKQQIVRETVHVEKGESLREELIAFLDAVRERKAPIVSGRDGLKALELADEIERKIG